MKRTLLSLALAGLATGALAQQDQTAMKYAKIITPDLEKMHLSIIASDEYEGRETGMPGAAKAADYIANEFKSLGLQPIVNGSYFFDVPIMGTLFTASPLVVNGTSYNSGPYARRASIRPGKKSGEFVLLCAEKVSRAPGSAGSSERMARSRDPARPTWPYASNPNRSAVADAWQHRPPPATASPR